MRDKIGNLQREEENAKRIDVRYGKFSCVVKVFSTGTIQMQGTETKLKETLGKVKAAIESGESLEGELLPFEIEAFPEKIKNDIPEIEPVIIRFLSEAILCLKANSFLGYAFLLGAASEKAMWILIEAYVNSIEDDENRTKLRERMANKFISRAYEEFKQSFRSCKTKPSEPALCQDLDTKIDSIFQFCRICRNEVGHPHIAPNLDKGVLIANMGQFVKYIQSIYQLVDYFGKNKTVV